MNDSKIRELIEDEYKATGEYQSYSTDSDLPWIAIPLLRLMSHQEAMHARYLRLIQMLPKRRKL